MEYDIEELDVVFFRHKFQGDRPEEDVQQLCEKGKVGLHWGQTKSTDPADYENSTAQNDLERLHDYGEKGVIVAAYYGNDYDIHSDEMLLGVVPPESTPVGERIGESDFKTLSLDEDTVESVSFRDYPVLSAVRPRGGSLCHW